MENNNLKDEAELLKQIKHHENELLELIRQRLGILIHSHQKSEFYHTLLGACKHFSLTPTKYLGVLKFGSNDSPEFSYLINGITIGETYFFRDNKQMQLLQTKLLPEMIEAKRGKGERLIRIWSAACSSGEDIYTIAMMLHELLPDYKSWTVRLMGTDINAASLQKGMTGRYGQWSMRTISEYFKKKYFVPINNLFQISPEMMESVRFSYLNLNENLYPSMLNGTNAQDLILCCNVLIYFDMPSIANLMKKLTDCLVPGGHLLLGASDPIVVTDTCLEQHHDHCFYFSRPIEQPILPTVKKGPVKIIDGKMATSFAVKTKEINLPSASQALRVDLDHINKLMSNSQWQSVLDLIDRHILEGKKSAFLLNAKATALANQGKLLQAKTCCQESLAMDAGNKQTYFIYAIISVELNLLGEAEAFLRKALFLDHRFVEAHFQLGLLLLRCKNQDAGLKSLNNALLIAKREDPACVVSEFNKLTFGQLVTILENEERAHGKQLSR